MEHRGRERRCVAIFVWTERSSLSNFAFAIWLMSSRQLLELGKSSQGDELESELFDCEEVEEEAAPKA